MIFFLLYKRRKNIDDDSTLGKNGSFYSHNGTKNNSISKPALDLYPDDYSTSTVDQRINPMAIHSSNSKDHRLSVGSIADVGDFTRQQVLTIRNPDNRLSNVRPSLDSSSDNYIPNPRDSVRNSSLQSIRNSIRSSTMSSNLTSHSIANSNIRPMSQVHLSTDNSRISLQSQQSQHTITSPTLLSPTMNNIRKSMSPTRSSIPNTPKSKSNLSKYVDSNGIRHDNSNVYSMSNVSELTYPANVVNGDKGIRMRTSTSDFDFEFKRS